MDIKRIVLGFFAAAAVLVGCEPQEEDFGVAKIEVSTSQLTFGPSSGSLTLQVTASREWTVSGLPDWIAVDPAGGAPAKSPQTVTVTVISNEGYDREADLAFTIGLMKEYVKVSQSGQKGQIDNGKGTLESPFSIEGVIGYINALDNPSAESSEKVYIKGIISSITEEYTAQYGNGTFDISDDGTTTGTQFKVYRAKYLGNKNFTSKDTQIKVGDEVIVYGNVVLYGSASPIYETAQGSSYLYSLNGVTGSSTPAGDPKGTGSKEDPFNVAAALKVVEGLSWTANDNYEKIGPFYVKGKISQIGNKDGEDLTYTQSGNYSNATFYISDDGTTDNEFYCYRIAYLGNKKYVAGQTDIKVGDEVIIYGELMNYRGNTPETVQGSAYLYSLNGDTGTIDPPQPPAGDPKGTGTLTDPYNPAGAINAVKDFTWTDNSTYDATGEVYVKGKISRIADKGTFTEGGTYGNASFYISEDGTSAGEFYCFRVLYLGNKKFESGQTDIKVGDEVVIYGQLMNYKGNTPETVSGKAYLYSLNGKTEDGGETPPSVDPNGSGTLDDPYNPTGAANAVKGLTWTDNSTYDATGEVYVKGKISRIADKGTFTDGGTYGNASFYISEDGSQSGEFYCFRVLYLGNKKFESGQTDIKVGDEVVIYGQLMNYKGNTPETVSGKAYLYSLNGKTEDGGETPPTPPSGDPSGTGTLADPYNPAGATNAVKDFTWTDNNTYDATGEVYVKGKISRIASKGTFTEGGTYGNASFYISEDGSQSGEFYCFRVLYLGNKKFESGQTDIKVGDEVVIYGQLMNYQGKTPETVSGKAYLYSLNGKTEDDGSGQGGGGEQQGNVVTVDLTAQGYANAQAFDELKVGDIILTGDKGTNSNGPKYYTSGNAVRFYGSNSLTVKSNGKNIVKIELTFGSSDGTNEITTDTGTWSTPTWTGSASSVKFTVGGSSGNRRIAKVVVTLAE